MLGNDLEVQRMLTRAFILTAPVDITLIPHERRRTASGGVELVAQPPRPVQTVKLNEPSTPRAPLRAADGVQREVDFVLVAEHDADLAVHDVFTHDGSEWELTQLYPDNGWERRAEVTRYAR